MFERFNTARCRAAEAAYDLANAAYVKAHGDITRLRVDATWGEITTAELTFERACLALDVAGRMIGDARRATCAEGGAS